MNQTMELTLRHAESRLVVGPSLSLDSGPVASHIVPGIGQILGRDGRVRAPVDPRLRPQREGAAQNFGSSFGSSGAASRPRQYDAMAESKRICEK